MVKTDRLQWNIFTIRCEQQTSNSCSVETSEHRERAHHSLYSLPDASDTHSSWSWMMEIMPHKQKAFKSCGARCPKIRKFIGQFLARSCWLKASRVVRPLILFIFLWSMWYFIAKTPFDLDEFRFYQNIFWCAHSCEADNERTNILKLGFLLWWTQNAKECFLSRQDIGICENLQCVQLLNT